MRRIDVLAVIELLRDLDRCRANEGRGSEAAVTKFINQTTEHVAPPAKVRDDPRKSVAQCRKDLHEIFLRYSGDGPHW